MSTQTNGNAQHVARFGHDLKWLHAAETRGHVGSRLLHQDERDLIQNNLLDDDREVRMKLRRQFEMGIDHFLGVKNTLLLWLATWDELLAQKRRYDLEGVLPSSREMLDASFLSLVTFTRRLNIGLVNPSPCSFDSSSLVAHPPGLPETGESLGATVTGAETEDPGNLDLSDLDELDQFLGLGSSDSEILLDSGSDDSEDNSGGARDTLDLTKAGQSSFETIFVLDGVDGEGNITSDYVAKNADCVQEGSLRHMRLSRLRPREPKGNTASKISKKRAASQYAVDSDDGPCRKK